jgi:hypothetical protein
MMDLGCGYILLEVVPIMFFKGSRYEHVGSNIIKDSEGCEVLYKKVRFIADTPADRSHTVIQGDRLDNLAYRYFRDPERFWRICDANLDLWPQNLVKDPGKKILIPPSED